ncbi:hypothetical protein Tco_0155435, partial [Tanacetum coccineum]
DSMEGVLIRDSPVGERVPPRPLTKEAIMSLNDYSMTFEHARSLFGVDLPTFKAKLLEFDIFVWKAPHGLRLRIHGGDYEILIAISKLRSHYVVRGTLSFSDVVNKIERSLGLPTRDYEDASDCAPYGEYAFSCSSNKDASDKTRWGESKLGNVEIGNGYGVPDGGAYYGSLMPLTILSGGNGNQKHESGQNISELRLKDEPANDNIVASDNDASNKDVSDNDDDEDASDYPSDKDASASRVAMLKIG